jgi:hypothetical protein
LISVQRLLLTASLCVIFSLSAMSGLASSGIRGPSPEQLSFQFKPNQVITVEFYIYGAERITSFMEGDLAAYAELTDQNQNGSERPISVTLRFPEKLPAGPHELLVGSREIPPPGNGVGGVASTRRRISVLALYDEPLLQISSLSIADIAVNASSTEAIVTVHSLTLQNLTVYSDIFVLGADNQTIAVRRTPFVELPSGETGTLQTQLPTRDLSPGKYWGMAVVHYAVNSTNQTVSFRIGTLDFFLDSYPPNLTVDTLNRFEFVVRSNWNNSILGIVGRVKLGPLDEKTPTVDVDPFGSAGLKTYLDTAGFSLGPLDGEIQLTYPEGNKAFPIRVEIVNETVPETKPTEEELQSPWNSLRALANPLALYIGTIIILLAFILILLLRRRRPETKAPPSKPGR